MSCPVLWSLKANKSNSNTSKQESTNYLVPHMISIPSSKPEHQEQILRLLALEVFGHETGWQDAMRRKRDEFRSLARRFKAVTAEAERLAEDPLFVLAPLIIGSEEVLAGVTPPSRRLFCARTTAGSCRR
jgi:hypothetical protein